MADAPAATTTTELATKVEIPADERGVLIPRNLSQSVAFANLIIKGGPLCIPRGLQRPNPQEQIATLVVAMQYGADLGLTPMKALRTVMVVNGNPGIYGEGPVGIVESRGLLEDMSDVWSGKPFADDWTVTVTVKRKGRPTPTVRSFSWAQAKKAKLTEKQGPWTNYPDRMMYHRAKTFAIRDAFPDVIGGFMSEDELDEIRIESAKVETGTPPSPGQTVETKPRGRKKAASPDAPPTVDADFTVGGAPAAAAPEGLPPAETPSPDGSNAFNDSPQPGEEDLRHCGPCSRKANDNIAHGKGEVCPLPPDPVTEKPKSAAPQAPPPVEIPPQMRAGIAKAPAPAPARAAKGDEDLFAGAFKE